MTYPRQPENIKVCPGCGTSLIDTARHCAVCGYVFTDLKDESRKKKPGQRAPQFAVNLPVVLGLIILIVSMNLMIVLGMRQRDQARATVAAEQVTATYIATTYVSPTPSPTATRTPAPPTATIEPVLEITVAPGESCLSIATRFKISYNSLVAKNKQLDCSLVKIGTVLIIPRPSPTPELINTPAATSAAP